jgi:hypothetical protein
MPGPKSGLPLDVDACRRRFDGLALQESFPSDECWPWPGARNHLGYGVVRIAGRMTGAHRAAWVADAGRDIPATYTIDHLCGQRSCVNPAHLEPVPHAVNLLRSSQTRDVRGRFAAGTVTA